MISKYLLLTITLIVGFIFSVNLSSAQEKLLLDDTNSNDIETSGTIKSYGPSGEDISVEIFGNPITPKGSKYLDEALLQGRGIYYIKRSKLLYCGKLVNITKNNVVVEIAENKHTFNIDKSTKLTESGKSISFDKLKKGDMITVAVKPKKTNATSIRKGPMLFKQSPEGLLVLKE